MYTIQWMKLQANRLQILLIGSLKIKDAGKFYNRLLAVHPSGQIDSYNKRHLFRMGDEDSFYSAGNASCLISFKSWSIAPFICYDLRFPELIRNRLIDTKPAYDVLLYVANWPSKRISHWDNLIKARAIENQCYAVGCNRTGTDGNLLTYNGHSQAIDMFGNALIAPQEQEGIYVVNMSAKELIEGRKNLPFLRDA